MFRSYIDVTFYSCHAVRAACRSGHFCDVAGLLSSFMVEEMGLADAENRFSIGHSVAKMYASQKRRGAGSGSARPYLCPTGSYWNFSFKPRMNWLRSLTNKVRFDKNRVGTRYRKPGIPSMLLTPFKYAAQVVWAQTFVRSKRDILPGTCGNTAAEGPPIICSTSDSSTIRSDIPRYIKETLNTCRVWLPKKWLPMNLQPHQIWTQSAQPFSRYRPRTHEHTNSKVSNG